MAGHVKQLLTWITGHPQMRYSSFRHCSELIQCRSPVPDRHCPLFRNAFQGRAEQLEHGIVTGNVTSVFLTLLGGIVGDSMASVVKTDRLGIGCSFLALLPGKAVQAVAQRMDTAELNLGIRTECLNCPGGISDQDRYYYLVFRL